MQVAEVWHIFSTELFDVGLPGTWWVFRERTAQHINWTITSPVPCVSMLIIFCCFVTVPSEFAAFCCCDGVPESIALQEHILEYGVASNSKETSFCIKL